MRARLIEILYDRVQYHKDKFIAPILYKEMCAMEVKKNGKVEHSSNSHDDSVFSYLHALYIWYDGENLVERYNIQKNIIKTDENLEVMESSYEDQIEKKERLDIKYLEIDEDNSDIADAYNFIDEGLKYKTSEQLSSEMFLSDINARNTLLAYDEKARESYAYQTGLDPSMFTLTNTNTNTVKLPDDLFGEGIASDFLFDDESRKEISPLAGNMAEWWNRV